jgi:hypothetical protein
MLYLGDECTFIEPLKGEFIFIFSVLYSTLPALGFHYCMSEDAGIERRTVAIVRRSNHSARSHPLIELWAIFYISVPSVSYSPAVTCLVPLSTGIKKKENMLWYVPVKWYPGTSS